MLAAAVLDSAARAAATTMTTAAAKALGEHNIQLDTIGALIGFLASGKSTSVTGQFFGFTGGWLP
jgi:hypothetical protein